MLTKVRLNLNNEHNYFSANSLYNMIEKNILLETKINSPLLRLKRFSDNIHNKR